MEFRSGNLFVRDMGSITQRHEVGWRMDGHTHNFHHNTMIISGRYRCTRKRAILETEPTKYVLIDDVERGPGTILPIEAHLWHSFECVEGPGMILCIYSHRDPQSGEVVQLPNGWAEAYA